MCRVWGRDQDRKRDCKKLQGKVGSQGMLRCGREITITRK